MTEIVRILKDELAKIGYKGSSVKANYDYPDVFARVPCEREVALAAFTHTPPSYRNAALGVINANGSEPAQIVYDHRALGAPLLLLIADQSVSVWRVSPKELPIEFARERADNLSNLFDKYHDRWSPGSIHRAKTIGEIDRGYQLDFVDIGLMPVIEGEIHSKLDRLLEETLAVITAAREIHSGSTINQQDLFRTTFRLLAAKILQDRKHPFASQWDPDKIETVLYTISERYQLPSLPQGQTADRDKIYGPGWDLLRGGISFRHISADDLAFVYENTLVTPETRKIFGTHSTPRQVADYVVNRLNLRQLNDEGDLRVYEPFAGAGVFLVAAMRYIKDILPVTWNDRKRHEFLVRRIRGDENDAFACEVARLSLILADYPNANGWRVDDLDLFANNQLVERSRNSDIVLCNPPFSDFNEVERTKYPKAARRSLSKPIWALHAILDSKPAALGFVLPPGFTDAKKYVAIRKRIEKTFQNIEVVSLPEHMFKVSQISSVLLIAKDRRISPEASPRTSLRSAFVKSQDRERFLSTGEISGYREVVRPALPTPSGNLWIRELDELWGYLSNYPIFGCLVEIHRGLEWHGSQHDAVFDSPGPGRAPGLHKSNQVSQFAHIQPSFLDIRPNRLRGNAIKYPWSQPKVLANAVRLGRGPWNMAAAIDHTGLVASQQLYGVWVAEEDGVPMATLEYLCALLNSPLTGAYLRDHMDQSPGGRHLVTTLKDIPIPLDAPDGLVAAVRAYLKVISDRRIMVPGREEKAAVLLTEIDALLLKAYDLPPRLERKLLEYFRGEIRPTVHAWEHWYPEDFQPFIPLYEYVSNDYQKVLGNWVSKVFEPLPESEAAALREFWVD